MRRDPNDSGSHLSDWTFGVAGQLGRAICEVLCTHAGLMGCLPLVGLPLAEGHRPQVLLYWTLP